MIQLNPSVVTTGGSRGGNQAVYVMVATDTPVQGEDNVPDNEDSGRTPLSHFKLGW